MKRKLASIRTISKFTPIKGADRIELATVDGWTVIVKKGEFKVGDKCVFFEIDSLLPLESRYSFLKVTKNKRGREIGYRIKTMKMRGALSQGLALPLSMFPELTGVDIGDDVTEILNVKKYEVSQQPTTKAGTKPPKKFPQFLRKTDQERIQNLLYYFDIYEDMEFEETLKLDGSSCTVFKYVKKKSLWQRIKDALTLDFNPYQSDFGVCSRNLRLDEDKELKATFNNQGLISVFSTNDFWRVVYKYELDFKLPIGYAVQGELIGPKIQGNHEKVDEVEFYIFDVFDISNQRYLTPDERHEFLALHDMIEMHIPVVKHKVKIFKECPTLDKLLKHVEGESMNKGVVSEGRVYKSVTDPNITFKAISNKFLLRYEA